MAARIAAVVRATVSERRSIGTVGTVPVIRVEASKNDSAARSSLAHFQWRVRAGTAVAILLPQIGVGILRFYR